MPTAFDPSFILDLTDKLGIIQGVKSKLLRQPDEAAEKLVVALDELSKVYLAIEVELVRYLCLSFEPPINLTEDRAALLSLEAGQLSIRVGEARGHCHKIGNIYYQYLKRWFDKVLKSEEATLMEDIFNDLSNADEGFIKVLDTLVQWIAPQATEVLDLVDSGQYQEANNKVRAARKEIMPIRQAIAKSQADLRNLQAEFIQISRTV